MTHLCSFSCALPLLNIAELDISKREKDAIQKLQNVERQKKINMETIESIQGRLKDEVQKWAHQKSLIRMLVTLDKIMPSNRISLPTFKLRLSSTSSDVRTAYKQALRCVHPDKLSNATMEDRVRGEYVFNALRVAFAKNSKSNANNATSNTMQQQYQQQRDPRTGLPMGGASPNRPIWEQRW